MHQRVEWTEAHGVVQVLDRHLALSRIDADPAAALPGDGKVRIQSQGMIDQSNPSLDVADDVSQRMCAPGERDGIRPAKVGGQSCKPIGLGRLGSAIDHPAIRLAHEKAARGERMRSCKCRIEFNRAIELP